MPLNPSNRTIAESDRDPATTSQASAGPASGEGGTFVDTDTSGSGSEVSADDRWRNLRRQLLEQVKKKSVLCVLGPSANAGQVYRWGVAASSGTACDQVTKCISRLACDETLKPKLASTLDLKVEAELFIACVSTGQLTISEAAAAVRWAAAMPALSEQLPSIIWWDLVGALQRLHEVELQRGDVHSVQHLILAGELGLTLSWRLPDLPSCKRLAKSSVKNVLQWVDGEDVSVASAVAPSGGARLALASLMRSVRIMSDTEKTELKKAEHEFLAELATWVAATTTHRSTAAFSNASRSDVKDDCGDHGILKQMIEFDRTSLEPAVTAALGERHTGGRLAWEVSLPESIMHSDRGNIAVMMPEWDVRRGRTHVDYSGEDVRLEMYAGKSMVLNGHWQVMIDVDDQQQHALGPWKYTCEYTDDDVHYLELEQPWTGGVTVQRQIMIVRDDRTVLLGDSVMVDSESSSASDPGSDAAAKGRKPKIRYTSRLPLAGKTQLACDGETRDAILSQKKPLGIVFPLAASEWKVGPTPATLSSTHDDCLAYSVAGQGNLYAPLWLDFQARRFNRKRTWRQLTIAEELRIVGHDEAAGFRVQVGSEQWMMYRSLGESCVRSVLGKHLIADFFCGRFHMGDGGTEELVTVDEGRDD